MPRRPIRLPACLQERLVPLLRLASLASPFLSSSPKTSPSTVFSFFLPFSCNLGSSVSHHCYFRSHLEAVYLSVSVLPSSHPFTLNRKSLWPLHLWEMQFPSQSDSSVVLPLSSLTQHISQSTSLNYSPPPSPTQALIPLISRPGPDGSRVI